MLAVQVVQKKLVFYFKLYILNLAHFLSVCHLYLWHWYLCLVVLVCWTKWSILCGLWVVASLVLTWSLSSVVFVI